MTSNEMIQFFVERYNLSSNSNDDKEDDEIYLLLNAAVNRVIKNRFTGNNDRFVPFDGDQKRSDDLRTLIKKSGELTPSVASISEIPNGKKYTIPTDFMFFIKAFCKIGNNWVSCEYVSLKDSYVWIQSQYNLPIIRQGKIIYDDATNFTILVDSDNYATLTNAIIQYLKKPNVISALVNCDLPDHLHEEIVEVAVGLAIEEIENPQRYQTHSDKLKTVE
jgi:hypothetical protein